jgi:CBS domain containing-hemolysin-like protein
VQLPETADVSTLGGFVTAQVGRMPRPGDRIRVDRFQLRVLEVKGRRVTKVLAAKQPEPLPGAAAGGG